jgi:hypothetical protein
LVFWASDFRGAELRCSRVVQPSRPSTRGSTSMKRLAPRRV